MRTVNSKMQFFVASCSEKGRNARFIVEIKFALCRFEHVFAVRGAVRKVRRWWEGVCERGCDCERGCEMGRMVRTQGASGALAKEITLGAYAHGAGGLDIRMVRDGV